MGWSPIYALTPEERGKAALNKSSSPARKELYDQMADNLRRQTAEQTAPEAESKQRKGLMEQLIEDVQPATQ